MLDSNSLSGFISGYSMRWVSRKIVEDLRFDAFKRLMILPVTYFDSRASGNIVSKITYETEQLSFIATKVALESIRESLTIVGIVGYMIYGKFVFASQALRTLSRPVRYLVLITSLWLFNWTGIYLLQDLNVSKNVGGLLMIIPAVITFWVMALLGKNL